VKAQHQPRPRTWREDWARTREARQFLALATWYLQVAALVPELVIDLSPRTVLTQSTGSQTHAAFPDSTWQADRSLAWSQNDSENV